MPIFPDLRLRIMRDDVPAMGPGKARLIELVEEHGSISAAARELNMSYRRAWLLIDAVNASFKKPLVVTEVGGKKGGGAAVTEHGKKIVTLYRHMEKKSLRAIESDLAQFQSHIKA